MLLDTHVLVWLFAGDERLGPMARQAAEAARLDGALLASPISFFEVATLVRRNRVDLGMTFERWIAAVTGGSIELAAIDISLAIAAGGLSNDIHGDPMDRTLIATALRYDVPLVTADRLILAYAAAGHLQVVDARH